MYKKIASWLLPVFIVFSIAIGYWGYSEYNMKSTLFNNSENQYQRAFYELSYYIDTIEEELGKSIAISNPSQIRRVLANVWRLSYAAQSRVGQLPFGLLEFSETEDFIAKVADFSYRTSIRDLDNEPISDDDWETLKLLYGCSFKIKDQVNKLHSEVITNQIRWTDFELNFAKLKEDKDHPIIKCFSSLEDEVTQFPEVSWGVGIDSIKQIKNDKIKRVSNGEIFTENMIKDKVIKFLDLDNDKQIEINKNPDGGDYVTYSIYITDSDEDKTYLDITEVEGNILWLLRDRVIGRPTIDLQEAESKAVEYLKKLEVKNAIATNIDDYENVAIISFAAYENNVVIYPDTIIVKIALDNGEIIGFSSLDYLLNNKKRNIEEVKITLNDAKNKLNPKIKIEEQRLAIIESYDGEEVLTYEFIGTIDNNTYKIYINTVNGMEEKIEKVDQVGVQSVFNYN